MASDVRVLVVDDEPLIREIVSFVVESQGYTAVMAGSAEEARLLVEREPVDMAVIDVMLPGESGVDLCRSLTEAHGLPVILLTALGETSDRIVGLEAGAMDYVGKPFSPKELSLRVAAVARRSATTLARDGRLSFHSLVLDTKKLTVHSGGHLVDLSSPQFRVLAAFMQHPTEVLPYSELLFHGWGSSDVLGGRELLKATVYRIRMKLAAASPGGSDVRITNVRGVGYALAAES